jgi:hypothetical protein
MGKRRVVPTAACRRGTRAKNGAVFDQLVEPTGWHREYARSKLRRQTRYAWCAEGGLPSPFAPPQVVSGPRSLLACRPDVVQKAPEVGARGPRAAFKARKRVLPGSYGRQANRPVAPRQRPASSGRRRRQPLMGSPPQLVGREGPRGHSDARNGVHRRGRNGRP